MPRARGQPSLVLGITGGIGSGKGLAAEFFRSQGAAVIDADEVARELSQPGGALVAHIVAEFGPAFVREDGSLARRELARYVFRDRARAARLNAVTHPVIMAEVQRRVEQIAARREAALICVVAPLLLEAGYGPGSGVDRLLVMTAAEDERVRRVTERDGVTAEEVQERIAAQMPVGEQQRFADWVVDTTASKQEALARLRDVWAELTGG